MCGVRRGNLFGALGAMAGRRLAKAKVAGLNPVFRSKLSRVSGGCMRGPGFLLPQRKAKVAGPLAPRKLLDSKKVSRVAERILVLVREKRQSCVSSRQDLLQRSAF